MLSNHIMIVLVVAIVMTGLVLRARYAAMTARERRLQDTVAPAVQEELQRVKQRLSVLEQIAIEKDNSLAREIEQLRDR
jgi:hypothetical protein